MTDLEECPTEQRLEDLRVLSEHVNDLLARWHSWSSGQTEVDGYKKACGMFLEAVCSRQYDDANGALDAHVDVVLMQAVDGVVDRITEPWRTALSIQARNLHTGRQVWNSPRLPSCAMLRGQIVVEARKKFIEGLARGGLL